MDVYWQLFDSRCLVAVEMASSQVSYDELMKQVQHLQKENTDLRRELFNSSTSIRQMESDSSALKDSLVTVGLTLNEADNHAAYDVAVSDSYTSRQTPPTLMPLSDLAFHGRSYSSASSKLYYRCVHVR